MQLEKNRIGEGWKGEKGEIIDKKTKEVRIYSRSPSLTKTPLKDLREGERHPRAEKRKGRGDITITRTLKRDGKRTKTLNTAV